MSLSLIKYPVPGSGVSVNANNGLNLSSATVKLGGPLIEFTNIDIDNQLLSLRDDSTQNYFSLYSSALTGGVGMHLDLYSQSGTAYDNILSFDSTQIGGTVSDYLNGGVVQSGFVITKSLYSVFSKTEIKIDGQLISIGDTANSDTVLVINDATGNHQFTGRVGFGIVPVARVDIAAGSATAGTAPIKLHSGSLLTTPVSGSIEFLTDKMYLTISTGAARKEFTINDSALDTQSIPFVTTNGRLKTSTLFNFYENALANQLYIETAVGSNHADAIINAVATWNTTGTPNLILGDITDTASNANSNILKFNVNNSTMFRVTKIGEISSANPGSGIGRWKLGTLISAASTVNTTQYVQIMINGAVVKLATMT